MTRFSKTKLALAACILVMSGAQSASFTPLGDLPGGNFSSGATGVSADGSVVVGTGLSASGNEAFRWTASTGMVGLGDLPGGGFGDFESRAEGGVSADGNVVVGWSWSASGIEAFRWTSAGGMVGLGDLPGGGFQSEAFGVSADGSVAVGTGISASGLEAFRWTSAGMVGLGDLPGDAFWSDARGVSDDGSVVVGSGNANSDREAFRWTSAGMVGLGDLPGGNFSSAATGVSADGNVVVGDSSSASGIEAFRWTSAGMVGLGDLPGGDFESRASAVSADGSVVVGTGISALSSPEGEAFIWTPANGMQSLRDLLVANGATGLTGWTLGSAADISPDGLWVVGGGVNPSGFGEAFLANISAPVVIDTDGDGVPDNEDAFPNDPNESVDTDGDRIGNNADPDDDNDGIPDNEDEFPLGRFNDVSPNHWAVTFIERLAESGITAGCGNDNYCPDSPVTRAQMSVFLVRGIHGSDFSPPAATGNVFLDVSAGSFAASFIEQFFLDGITSGCGSNNYCPDAEVTRDQMAVFLLRAKHGAGYSPPAAIGVFNDVPLNYWAVAWIEQLATEGITAGCGNGNYCPGATVTRDQMAVFLVRTFGL